jgi:hypothetical protein
MFNLFTNKKLIEQAKNEVYSDLNEEKKRDATRKNECIVIELEMKLGKLVIYVSNKMENVKVGVAKSITYITKAKNPILIVEDIITKQEVMVLGIIFDYSEQKFNGLNKLDTNERIAILYKNFTSEYVDKTATQTEECIDSEIWKQKIMTAINSFKENNV